MNEIARESVRPCASRPGDGAALKPRPRLAPLSPALVSAARRFLVEWAAGVLQEDKDQHCAVAKATKGGEKREREEGQNDTYQNLGNGSFRSSFLREERKKRS